MNKVIIISFIFLTITACTGNNKTVERIPVAEVGKVVLYYDELPKLLQNGINNDSIAIIQNYINKWAKRELLLQRAEQNLSQEIRDEINNQIEETRANLVIYQYQRQMMLEKMDTTITDAELENY